MATLRLILDHGDDARDLRWAAVIETKLRSLGNDVRRASATPGSSVGVSESAVEVTERMVVLLSRTYVAHGMQHVRERLRRSGEAARIIVLRLDDVPTPPEFHQGTVTDLRRLPNEGLRRALSGALSRPSGAASGAAAANRTTPFARDVAARVLPLPNRDPGFVGRAELIKQLRNGLGSSGPVVLHGSARTGKSAIAAEFAHRHADEYDRTAWIDASSPEGVPEQLKRLAVAAGLCAATSTAAEARRAIKRHLLKRERWLLVLDDARPASVAELNLGSVRWHMVVTSRESGWDRLATVIGVGGFGPAESLEVLQRKVRQLPRAAAEELAGDLADDAQGLFQVAGALAAGTVTVDSLRAGLDQPSDSAAPSAHQGPGVAAPTVSRLSAVDPAAADLLGICSMIAADWIPLDLFTAAPVGTLPPALAAVAAEARRFSALTSRLSRLQLISLGLESVKLSTTAEVAMTGQLDHDRRSTLLRCAHAVLVAAKPDDGRDPRNWARWRQLTPHLLALAPEGRTESESLQAMLNSALVSMIERGDVDDARPVAGKVHAALESSQEPGSHAVLVAAQTYATCLRAGGDYQGAYDLDSRVHELCIAQRGRKDPATLEAAARVARDLSGLGRHDDALPLIRRTYHVAKEELGLGDPLTLSYGDTFGRLLLAAGEVWGARAQLEQILAERTRVLGMRDRDTLATQAALAEVFDAMNDLDTAKWHHQRVLKFRRQQLGDDHPETMESAAALQRATQAIEAVGRSKKQVATEIEVASAVSAQIQARPQRIVALAEEWSSVHGGISTYNRDLCRALARAGHQITCVVLSSTSADERNARDAGVELRTAGRIADDDDVNRLALVGNLPDGLDPDFVIGHSRHTGPAALTLVDALTHGRTDSVSPKRLHFIHFSPEELERHKLGREGEAAERAARRRAMEIRLGSKAHRVITVGPTLHGRYAADFKLSGPPVINLSPGFDGADAVAGGPPPGKPRVLMLGRMEDYYLKGLDVAARALARALQEGVEEFIFFVVGAPESLGRKLEDTVREGGLPIRDLNILPYTSDPAELEQVLMSASLLLMPSRAEGFGLVGQEAIARGIPVVVSASSGLGELLRGKPELRAGDCVVPVTEIGDKDDLSWSRAIMKVLMNREAAFERAEELRAGLAKDLPWSNVAETLIRKL